MAKPEPVKIHIVFDPEPVREALRECFRAIEEWAAASRRALERDIPALEDAATPGRRHDGPGVTPDPAGSTTPPAEPRPPEGG